MLASESGKAIAEQPAELLEVVAVDERDVVAAMHGGADRCELVIDLEHGGRTPRLAEVSRACAVGIPVRVMLRARRDFLLPESEFAATFDSAAEIVARGADGLVMGFLTADGELAVDQLDRIARAHARGWTLHRAFDAARHRVVPPIPGLDAILTAGGPNTVPDHLSSLLSEPQAAPRQAVLAGRMRASLLPALRRAGYRRFHIGDAVRRSWADPVEPAKVAAFRA